MQTHLNGDGVGDVGERGRDVEQEVEDDEVVPLLRLVLQLGALHPHARPYEALGLKGSSLNDVRVKLGRGYPNFVASI